MKLAHSVQQAEKRRAKLMPRVVLLAKPTMPPPVEDMHARTWFAIHTMPGSEWTAWRELRRAGYETFLPVSVRWIVQRRVKTAKEKALLTRYVFVGLPRHLVNDDATWAAIRATPGVSKVLGCGDVALHVPRVNLLELAGQQVSGVFDGTLAPVYLAGDEVQISEGPFRGWTGVVQQQVPAKTPIDQPVPLLLKLFGGRNLAHIPLAQLHSALIKAEP